MRKKCALRDWMWSDDGNFKLMLHVDLASGQALGISAQKNNLEMGNEFFCSLFQQFSLKLFLSAKLFITLSVFEAKLL
jgi:hypothetical protein